MKMSFFFENYSMNLIYKETDSQTISHRILLSFSIFKLLNLYLAFKTKLLL